MAMKVVHRAMFFRTTEDIRLNHAFILRWYVDEEKECGGFNIEPPEVDDDTLAITTQYSRTVDEDFREMVRMLEIAIRPVAVVVDGEKKV